VLAARHGTSVITTIGGSLPSAPPATDESLDRAHSVRRAVIVHNLRLLRDHGVRIAIGSDAGEGSPVAEALILQRLGVFSTARLLNMLTYEASRVVFPRRSTGRLEDGYEASFLALTASALQLR